MITEIPTFYIENTTWILVINEKAKPYCQFFNLLNPRRKYANRTRFTTYNNCDCCEAENYLTINFHNTIPKRNIESILSVSDSIEAFAQNRKKSIMPFVSFTLDKHNVCNPLIQKNHRIKEPKEINSIEELLCIERGWKKQAFYLREHDSIYFNTFQKVKKYDNGKVYFLDNGNFIFKGVYRIEGQRIFETIFYNNSNITNYTFFVIDINKEFLLFEIEYASFKGFNDENEIRHLMIPN